MTVADRALPVGHAREPDLATLLLEAAAQAGPPVDPSAGIGGSRQIAPLRVATQRITDLDPIAVVAAARELNLEAVLWLQPADGVTLVGIGRAWAVEPAGDGRFAAAAEAWGTLLAGATLGGLAAGRGGLPRGAGPILVGGLGFTGATPKADDAWGPFGAASLVLPGLVFARTPDGSFLTAAIGPGGEQPSPRALARQWDRLADRAAELAPAPGAMVARPADAPLLLAREQPDRADWERLVALIAGAVGRGRLDKVVLARRVDLRSPRELDPVNALRRLAAAGPESTTFAFARGGATFLGATPERLVRTEGRAFRTVAIAGSAARGRDAAEDARLAASLLASDKEREEHGVVVEMLRASLTPLVDRLDVATEPAILRLRDVQHLATTVEGTLRRGAGLLALAGRLHPTPAVGGEPRAAALDVIAEHEGFDRGWYAGPVGWVGADGDGEMVVALRCGLVAGQRATLFAGCGIVADSDPTREWEESRIKLRPVVSSLGRLAEDAR